MSLVVAASIWLGISVPAFAQPRSGNLYLYPEAKSFLGHTFVEFYDPRDGYSWVGGFYPNGRVLDQVAGYVSNDAGRKASNNWEYRLCVPLTAAQWASGTTFSNTVGRLAATGAPGAPDYNLRTQNCMDFGVSVLQNSGYNPAALPNFKSRRYIGALISDPNAFKNSLKALGNGATVPGLPGSVVELNPGFVPSPPPIIPGVMPLQYALANGNSAADIIYEYAIDAALGDTVAQEELSSYLGIMHQQTVLGPFSVGTGGAFGVTLSNTLLSEQEVAVDWNDGSDPEANNSSFAHTFNSPGAYNVELAVLDDGFLRNYQMLVSVDTSASSNGVTISLPNIMPGAGLNPGQQPPPPLAEVPEPSSVVMLGFSLLLLGRCGRRGRKEG